MKCLLLTSLAALAISGCGVSQKNIEARPVALNYYVEPSSNDSKISTYAQSFLNDREDLSGEIDMGDFQTEILQIINKARAEAKYCGSPAKSLEWNDILSSAASAHAKDLAMNSILTHDGSGTKFDVARDGTRGSKFYERLAYFGYPIQLKMYVGETLALTNAKYRSNRLYPNFIGAMQNLLKHPPHCKIIMDNKFDYVGVGIYKTKNRYYLVMDFSQK